MPSGTPPGTWPAKGADYIFTGVKDNQPKLFDALDALPWRDVPVQHTMSDRAHGRDETRTIQVLPAPAGIWPYAAQAFLIERHVADLRGNPKSAIAALGITSLTPQRAGPAAIAGHVRGHWGIENKLHYVRDVTARTARGSAPETRPMSWPASATWSSPPCAPAAGPISPPDSAGHPATTPTRCHYSISQRENAGPVCVPP